MQRKRLIFHDREGYNFRIADFFAKKNYTQSKVTFCSASIKGLTTRHTHCASMFPPNTPKDKSFTLLKEIFSYVDDTSFSPNIGSLILRHSVSVVLEPIKFSLRQYPVNIEETKFVSAAKHMTPELQNSEENPKGPSHYMAVNSSSSKSNKPLGPGIYVSDIKGYAATYSQDNEVKGPGIYSDKFGKGDPDEARGPGMYVASMTVENAAGPQSK